jgi:SAM-dependent methyltransferase
MYSRSAPYFDDIYAFLDYGAASRQVHAAIQQHCPAARTVLDVGCGTGRHLELLSRHYDVEGLDASDPLLAAARARCPQARFHRAEMQRFDLGRQFDVVTCLFSAIAYVKTAAALSATIDNFGRHLADRGVLIIEPWYSSSQYEPGRLTTNVVRKPGLHIAWMYVNDRDRGLAVEDMHFVIGTPDGLQHFVERHELGLFSSEDYHAAFAGASLEAHYTPDVLFGRGMYVASRTTPAESADPSRAASR